MMTRVAFVAIALVLSGVPASARADDAATDAAVDAPDDSGDASPPEGIVKSSTGGTTCALSHRAAGFGGSVTLIGLALVAATWLRRTRRA